MKIGLILECGPDGPDKHVCKHLAQQCLQAASQQAELSFATLNNKPSLLRQCGDAASSLLAEGCDRVLIVWDLYPAWREKGQKPCRHEDREAIFDTLQAADVDRSRVALVCIQEELEAWLLADKPVLLAFLQSFNSHIRDIECPKKPERIGANPKTHLNRLMQQHTRRKYEDHVHARKIAARITDLSHLRKACPIFQRFEKKVLGQ